MLTGNLGFQERDSGYEVGRIPCSGEGGLGFGEGTQAGLPASLGSHRVMTCLGHSGRLSFISRPHFLRLHNGLSGRLGSSPKRPSSLPTQEIDMLSWRFLKLPSQEEKSQDPKGCVGEGQGTRYMGTLMTLSLGCPS